MKTLLVCINERFGYNSASCAQRGSKALLQQLKEAVASQGMGITVDTVVCFGKCKEGPNVRLAPGGRFWHHVDAADVPGIVAEVAALNESQRHDGTD